jgi:type IV pilus assembly protein PilW
MDVRGGGPAGNRPDGDFNDEEENLRYALDNDADGDGIADGTPCHLGRERIAGGGLQPICENVDALNFVYLDADGVVLDPVGTPGDIGRIRSIEVTVVARSGEQLPGLVNTSVDNRVYRNQRGDIILPAQGDDFIRLVFSTTIKARNLGL